MVPGHPCYSALGAFHPTPIASNRTSAQPTDRLPPARKTERGVKERDVETGDDEAAHEQARSGYALPRGQSVADEDQPTFSYHQ